MKLVNRHIFQTVRIMKKAKIKELLKELPIREKNDTAQDYKEKLGKFIIETIMDIFENEDVERMIYGLLADISCKTADEISCMDIEETVELLKIIGKENNISRFFQSVMGILKKT